LFCLSIGEFLSCPCFHTKLTRSTCLLGRCVQPLALSLRFQHCNHDVVFLQAL
jgi:hypothetical protein